MHENGQIFAARYVCIFRVGLDFCEVAEVLETFLRGVHANRVENVARGDEHFAPDDLILGARVALNVHPVHKRAHTLLDCVMHVYKSSPSRGAFGCNDQINVAAAAVRVSDGLGVIAKLFW